MISNFNFIVALEVMEIDEEQAHVVQVHSGRDTAVLFDLVPCTLHIRGMMDIIYGDDAFGVHAREEIVHIADGGFVRMIGIHKGNVKLLARVY